MTDSPEKRGLGTLYVTATPIGNLEDMTLRAIRILREVDEIYAEDTRRTRKLLQAYKITTPVYSLYDAVERKRARSVIDRLRAGKCVAYVSDAGTPGISDPGYLLIGEAIQAGVPVSPVPGVSAVIAALSASGLPMHNFVFQGFLPSKPGQRRQMLEECRLEKRTMVFYESPRRLRSSLEDIGAIMGMRPIVVARELTKLYEEFIRGNPEEILEALSGRNVRGEITLIVGGRQEKDREYADEELVEMLRELSRETSLSLRDRVDRVAAKTGLPRKNIYRIALTGKFS
ncbi:MAG: 16S rRNA (cytidine(1402)-2'-O)-methyltransferase [Pseudomonadota bacterium]|nr:16S rRNA (cytidine(1402)-2'-O)-methyltransferase [Pseudomonadota bacterium]